MSPHRPRGRTIWRIKLPTRYGWVDRSTGSRDKSMARAMERMLEDLGPKGQRAWDLLDRVEASTLSLGRLYDFWRMNQLDQLRAELHDVDLGAYVTRWHDSLADRVSEGEQSRYLTHLRTLIPETTPFPRSHLTPDHLERWLTQLPVSSATKRKYFAAAASFIHYCRTVQRILDRNPLADLRRPKAGAPRSEWYNLEEAQKLVAASPEPWQSLFALLYGTGLEVSVALGLRKRDVDLEEREIRARGTKAHSRDRIASLSRWALPWVTRLVQDKLPDAPLFPHMDRWRANRKHGEAAQAAGLRVLRLHDARHHWAVRALKLGASVEVVSRQLGHANGVMVLKVYGKYLPSREDRKSWEPATIPATAGGST